MAKIESQVIAIMILSYGARKDIAQRIASDLAKILLDPTSDVQTLEKAMRIVFNAISECDKKLEALCPSVDTAM